MLIEKANFKTAQAAVPPDRPKAKNVRKREKKKKEETTLPIWTGPSGFGNHEMVQFHLMLAAVVLRQKAKDDATIYAHVAPVVSCLKLSIKFSLENSEAALFTLYEKKKQKLTCCRSS